MLEMKPKKVSRMTNKPCSSEIEEFDAIILGAGVSGLVAAKILKERGCHRILIMDEYERVGGNHISCNIGPFTFDIGTLIFQDDSPLMKYFPEFLPLYHPIDWSISRVAPDNAIRDYPISIKEEVFGTGPLEVLRLFGSLAWSRMRSLRIANTDDYARYWIGSCLFERSGLASYIERLHGVPASAIDLAFAEKRMNWIANATSVRRQVERLLPRKRVGKTNQSFVRPRSGFDEIYLTARRTLEQRDVSFALGETLRSVTRHDALFRVATDRKEIAGRRLISTIPVDKAYALCGLSELGPLSYSKIVSLFFSFDGNRGFQSNILYNFSREGDWKRLTMFSDFYGLADGRQYFGVEVTTTKNDQYIAARAAAAFKTDVEAKGLFKGSLTFVGFHELDNAYPVYIKGAMERANCMIAALAAFGAESMGRQGGFDYLPTARQVTLAIEEAMNQKNKLN